jgi:Fic-DOC domain mobile mystery protein B
MPDVDGATPLDEDEAEGLIPSHISTREELNEWEQRNIAKAVYWISERRSRDSVLTVQFIRELHQRMFDETWKWAGTFRKTAKNIGVSPERIGEEVLNLVRDTEAWIQHGTYSADELAARFHHRLVSIHPFPNGNGRHARLMTEALQREIGATAFTWGAKRGEGNLNAEGQVRKDYISALKQADKGEYKDLIAFARS